VRFAALALLVLTTCSTAGRSRCEKACRVEADCADETEAAEVDVGECVETCRELERAPETQAIVLSHVDCVEAAKGCAAILECP
jgi:hypothetical protein